MGGESFSLFKISASFFLFGGANVCRFWLLIDTGEGDRDRSHSLRYILVDQQFRRERKGERKRKNETERERDRKSLEREGERA